MDDETFTRIVEEEKAFGVDYEKIEQKYYFVFEDENLVTNTISDQPSNSVQRLECIYIRPGYLTPSQKEKITEAEEIRLRIFGSEMILEAGVSLRLPWYAIATAQAIFQRFYYRKSFLEYDIKDIVMAVVFLTTKVDECPRKVRDIVSVCYHVFKIKSGVERPIPVLSLSSNYYLLMRQAVVDSERIVLKELGFELHRITEHAHKYLIYYLKTVRVPREVAQKAWCYVNDCYKGTLCVNYPPHILATSCLYLAIRINKASMPRCIWWAIFEVSIKNILEACADIMTLYEQEKMDMEGLRVLMNDCFARNNIELDYVIDNEFAFEKDQEERARQEKAEAKAQAVAEKAKSYDKRDKKDGRRPEKSRSREHREKRDYRSDQKKKKRNSRDRRSKERRRSPSSSSSDSDDRKKKRKHKKDRKHRSPSSSEERSRKRSHSHSRRDKKKHRDRDERDRKHKDRRDRSRSKDRRKDYQKESSRPLERPRLERKSTLEEINDQIKKTEVVEHEKHNKQLEQNRSTTIKPEEEEAGLDSFLKKDKQLTKSNSMSISVDTSKAAALGTTKNGSNEIKPEVVNVNFIKSAKKEEPADHKQSDKKSNGTAPAEIKEEVPAQANGEDDEEAQLLALRQKIQETRKTKKKY